jgi:hypothetical protein
MIMKNLEKFDVKILQLEDCANINGGVDKDTSFWEDAAFLIGATLRSIYEIGKAGGAYQQSLPSSLKK